MKKGIQLKIKELLEELEYNGNPIFDNIVVNYRKEEDENDSSNNSGDSGCVILLKTQNFPRKGIRKQMRYVLADGFMAMIFKKTHPDYDNAIEKIPELVVDMLYKNPTLDGLVNECYPSMIDWNLYRTDAIGVFTMVDFQFKIEGRFFLDE